MKDSEILAATALAFPFVWFFCRWVCCKLEFKMRQNLEYYKCELGNSHARFLHKLHEEWGESE